MKNAILVFPILSGSAEAQVILVDIIKSLLIAYFIGNISAKNTKIRSQVSKLWQAKGGTFLRHGDDKVNLNQLSSIYVEGQFDRKLLSEHARAHTHTHTQPTDYITRPLKGR